MPIVVLCPGCKTRLTVGDDRAGTSLGCPRCATAIRVPAAVTPPPPPPPPSTPPRVIDYKPESEPPDSAPRRPRRARGAPVRWVALAVLLFAVVAVAVWLGARWERSRTQSSTPSPGSSATPSGGASTLPSGSGDGRSAPVAPAAPGGALPPPPDVSGDGPDWTYRELLDHLRSKGLKIRMTPFHGSQMYVLAESDDEVFYAYTVTDQNRSAGLFYLTTESVICFKCPSAKDAKDAADRRESGTFFWGRFVFRGPADGAAFLAVRKALTGK